MTAFSDEAYNLSDIFFAQGASSAREGSKSLIGYDGINADMSVSGLKGEHDSDNSSYLESYSGRASEEDRKDIESKILLFVPGKKRQNCSEADFVAAVRDMTGRKRPEREAKIRNRATTTQSIIWFSFRSPLVYGIREKHYKPIYESDVRLPRSTREAQRFKANSL